MEVNSPVGASDAAELTPEDLEAPATKAQDVPAADPSEEGDGAQPKLEDLEVAEATATEVHDVPAADPSEEGAGAQEIKEIRASSDTLPNHNPGGSSLNGSATSVHSLVGDKKLHASDATSPRSSSEKMRSSSPRSQNRNVKKQSPRNDSAMGNRTSSARERLKMKTEMSKSLKGGVNFVTRTFQNLGLVAPDLEHDSVTGIQIQDGSSASTEHLLNAIMTSDVEWIKAFEGDWNFFGSVKGRRDPVTPLSVLCRPELAGALKGVNHITQVELVRKAMDSGADPWLARDDGNARAITDTVYQGKVELLSMFVIDYGVSKKKLRDYRFMGSSLLHMACYDSRYNMIDYLVTQVGFDPDVEAEGGFLGQTPLFWIFARGPCDVKCAELLYWLKADPFKLIRLAGEPKKEEGLLSRWPCCRGKKAAVAAAEDKDKEKEKHWVYMSPFSLSIRTFPEFALICLEERRREQSNRGLSKAVTYDWTGILTKKRDETDKERKARLEKKRRRCCCQRKHTGSRESADENEHDEYIEPRFAEQLQPEKPGWETFNYCKDPEKMVDVYSLMINYRRKALLTTKVVQKATQGMWKKYAQAFYRQQVLIFALYYIAFSLATLAYPRHYFDWNNDDDDIKTALTVALVSSSFAFLISCYFLSIEVREMTTIEQTFQDYLMKPSNWWDLALNFSVWALTACVIMRYNVETRKMYTVINQTTTVIIFILHVCACQKFLVFASTPVMMGPMVSMLGKMVHDVLKFMLLWLIFFSGYFQMLWAIWKNLPEPDGCVNVYNASNMQVVKLCASEDGESRQYQYYDALTSLIRWMFGELGEYEETVLQLDSMLESALLTLVYYSWLLLVSIMLVNMLIAMMNNSYQTVWEDQVGEWMLGWTQSVNELWLSVPDNIRQAHLRDLYTASGKNIDEPITGQDDRPVWEKKGEMKEMEENVMWLKNKMEDHTKLFENIADQLSRQNQVLDQLVLMTAAPEKENAGEEEAKRFERIKEARALADAQHKETMRSLLSRSRSQNRRLSQEDEWRFVAPESNILQLPLLRAKTISPS